MPVDYSKWDKLELSDDEDFECHPNVDKKSMIRWKQAQIHKQRRETTDQTELLKHEHSTTIEYLKYIGEKVKDFEGKSGADVLVMLDGIAKEVDQKFTDPMRQDSLSRMKSWTFNDPPDWGSVLKLHKPWNELIMTIGKNLEAKVRSDGLDANLTEFLKEEFQQSNKGLQDRQLVIEQELKRLEQEHSKKITADDMHTGFDKTMLSEKKPEHPAYQIKEKPSPTEKQSSNETIVETIHSPDTIKFSPEIQDLIFSELESTDQDLLTKHKLLLELSRTSDYAKIFQLLKQNPDLMSNESFEEALLLRALCLEIIQDKSSKTAVMVSLVLKFTRSLGPQGLDLFFQKLMGTGTQAQTLFFTDLENTFNHIQKRAKVLRIEKLQIEKEHQQRLKQRQELYQKFKQADGTLKLPVGQEPTEMELKQKEWFDVLPEYYKEGLLLEDVEKINRYLGSLEPEEADYQSKIACKAGFISFQDEESE